MIKKRYVLIAAATFIFMVNNVSAMQLNITIGNDIKTNQDTLSFSYDLYYNVSSTSQQHMASQMSGITEDKFPAFIQGLKYLFSDIQPMDAMDGKHSEIAFGYAKKDGSQIYPASCQKIIAKPVMNILINETGCMAG